MKRIKHISLVAAASLVLIGCGSDNTTTDVKSVTGQFIDSAVEGLTYECETSGNTGITNSKGEFTCNEGENVTFSINGFEIGTATAADVITPQSLHPDNAQAAIDVAQLLQTMDSDGDTSNGISIDTKSQMYEAMVDVKVELGAIDFDSVVTSHIGTTLVNEITANAHMLTSIATINGETVDSNTFADTTATTTTVTQSTESESTTTENEETTTEDESTTAQNETNPVDTLSKYEYVFIYNNINSSYADTLISAYASYSGMTTLDVGSDVSCSNINGTTCVSTDYSMYGATMAGSSNIAIAYNLTATTTETTEEETNYTTSTESSDSQVDLSTYDYVFIYKNIDSTYADTLTSAYTSYSEMTTFESDTASCDILSGATCMETDYSMYGATMAGSSNIVVAYNLQ